MTNLKEAGCVAPETATLDETQSPIHCYWLPFPMSCHGLSLAPFQSDRLDFRHLNHPGKAMKALYLPSHHTSLLNRTLASKSWALATIYRVSLVIMSSACFAEAAIFDLPEHTF